MTTICMLCRIIAQRRAISKASVQDQAGLDLLADFGLVRSAGVLQSVCCEACDDPHDAPVVFESGRYGHYCDQAGFVTLAEDSLQTVQPDIGNLVAHLADAFDCKRRKTSPIHNETWRVGAMDTPGGDLVIYFQPTLRDHHDIQEIKTALSQEVRSQFTLVLTADGLLVEADTKTAMLDETISLAGDGKGFTVLVDPSEVVGAPQKAQGGQPSQYAANLNAFMKERMSDGCAFSGRNEEARALKALYRERHPDKAQPSLPTIKRHLTNFRTGS